MSSCNSCFDVHQAFFIRCCSYQSPWCSSDPIYFGACSLAVECLFACRSCCVDSSIYKTLPLQPPFLAAQFFLWPVYLFDIFSVVLDFIALIFDCFETRV
jgi:hypothetical protein